MSFLGRLICFCVALTAGGSFALGQDARIINHGNWIPEEELKNPILQAPVFSEVREVANYSSAKWKKKEGLYSFDFLVVGPKGEALNEATVSIFRKQIGHYPQKKEKFKFVSTFHTNKDGLAKAKFWVSDHDQFLFLASSKDGRVKFTKGLSWAQICWRRQLRLRLVPTISVEFQFLDYKTDAPISGVEYVLSPFPDFAEVDRQRFPTGKADQDGYLRVSNWPVTSEAFVFANHSSYHDFKKPVVRISRSENFNLLKEPKFAFDKPEDLPAQGFSLADVQPGTDWSFFLQSKKDYQFDQDSVVLELEKAWGQKQTLSTLQKSDWLASRCSENCKEIEAVQQRIERGEEAGLVPAYNELDRLETERRVLSRYWRKVASAAKSEEEKWYCVKQAFHKGRCQFAPPEWSMEWMVGKFWNRPEIENELQMIRSFAVNPGDALRKIEKGHASSVVRAKALKLYFNLISSPFTYFGEFPVNSLHHLQINKRLTEKSKVYKELLEKYREEKLDYGTVASNLEYYRQEMELLQFGKPFPETLLHKGEQPDAAAKESVFEEGKVKLRSDAAVLLHFVSPNQIDPLSEVRRLKEKYQKELQVVCVFDGNRKLCHSVLKQHKLPWTFYYENYTDVWPGFREPPSIQLFLNDFPVYKLRKFQSVLLSPGRKLFAIGEMTDEMDSLVQQALKSVR